MKPNVVTGTVTATGAAMNISIGFRPKRVLIHNETTAIGLDWTDTMAAGKGIKTLANGTRSFIASAGISHYTGAAPAALTGTLAVTAASPVITGTSTKFLTEVRVGDVIAIPGIGATSIDGTTVKDQSYGKVVAIASDTSCTCDRAFDYAGSGKTGYNQSGFQSGFTLGTDSINTSTNVLHYIAERSD